MASSNEHSSPQTLLSDHVQKVDCTHSADTEDATNLNMSDENRDPSSNPLANKIRPKPVDARSAAASSFRSSIDSPKSATITNVSQRLPSTSVEVSVGEILSTGEKRASVSVRNQHHRHSSSSCSSSEMDDINESTFLPSTTIASTTNKMDLGEATRELTRLLHIGNDSTSNEIHLNPNAPDFTPIDFSPTYRSELAPAHLYRRATQNDYYNNRQTRSRYYSESYNHSIPPNTSTIRPLLSLVPQYIPYHRQSLASSSNSWWPQEYSNPPSSTTSYHSKAAYPLYSPLMAPLTDDSLYPSRHTSKRQRIHSNRAFVFPNQTTTATTNRKRSYSGPETPLQSPPTHLNGIHSLAKIMIDILRMIDPLPIQEESKSKNGSISPSYQQRKYRRPSNQSYQRRSQTSYQRNESVDVEDVFVDDEISTISALIQTTSELSDERKEASKTFNEQPSSLISTDTNVKNRPPSTTEESFYEITNKGDFMSTTTAPTSVLSGTTIDAAHTNN